MATEIPPSTDFTGLTRTVMEYSEQFEEIVRRAKHGLADADWATIESYVDVPNFVRVGVFLTDEVERIDWATYKGYLSKYGGLTVWDGKLRRITEGPRVVIQELEERNTRDGITDVANTCMFYTFNEAGRICELDVYVAHLEKRPVG